MWVWERVYNRDNNKLIKMSRWNYIYLFELYKYGVFVWIRGLGKGFKGIDIGFVIGWLGMLIGLIWRGNNIDVLFCVFRVMVIFIIFF